MKKYYYDLHIHSCLSPCGDNDSTPDSIAGMGELNGLNIMALTDHNSLKNCPAFFEAARRHGIVPIAGMELTTAEDIHIICLFESLDEALGFDSLIDSKRIKIKNKAEIFGEQLQFDFDALDREDALNEAKNNKTTQEILKDYPDLFNQDNKDFDNTLNEIVKK